MQRPGQEKEHAWCGLCSHVLVAVGRMAVKTLSCLQCLKSQGINPLRKLNEHPVFFFLSFHSGLKCSAKTNLCSAATHHQGLK